MVQAGLMFLYGLTVNDARITLPFLFVQIAVPVHPRFIFSIRDVDFHVVEAFLAESRNVGVGSWYVVWI